MMLQVIEGSVIIIVTLAESNSTTTGANLTVLVGQVEQDVRHKACMAVNNDII